MLEFNKSYIADSDIVLEKLISMNYTFDLILTDPPYNLNKDFGNNSDRLSFDEFLNINKKRIADCHKLLNKNGSLIWFGIHKYIGYLQVLMYEEDLYYRGMNIWHYENGFSRSKKIPSNQYEPFLWFSNNKKKWTYNADEVRVPYKSEKRLKTPVYYKDSKGNKKIWQPNPKGALRGDIWSYPTLAGSRYKNERTSHPTQKPIALIMEIIKAFCPKDEEGIYNGTILDPFHGSGTVGVCCELLNKKGHKIKWIGLEIEENWVNISNDRINNL
ncbi:DNA-methyltransferase [Staphylococcus hominis]|uniref:DNA-methyltransferase n=1 Tax=Staphylococcus hominis TaxID=1290 RepID=UPI00265C11B3|nr:site-specific DNA-methyltransferase [Staphylococcus hominis]MDO0983524.1 site-specific DNA-methyltransferase [Staphylococcus hominis]